MNVKGTTENENATDEDAIEGRLVLSEACKDRINLISIHTLPETVVEQSEQL